jgi:hypothetical protein
MHLQLIYAFQILIEVDKNCVPAKSGMHLQKRPTKEPCLKNQKLKLLFCTKHFVEIPKEVEHY